MSLISENVLSHETGLQRYTWRHSVKEKSKCQAEGRHTGTHLLGRASCALAIFAALLTSSAPSPLYPIYIQQWGLADSAGTLIFAIYAAGTLLSLFMSSWLDSHAADRRQILLPALVLAVGGAIVFALAGNLWTLLIGRLLSGISTGLITSVASTALFELDDPQKRGRAAMVSTIAFTAGAALGPCLSSLALALDAAPLVSPFLCISAISLLAFAGLASAPWPSNAEPKEAVRAQDQDTDAFQNEALRSRQFILSCLSICIAWTLGSTLMAVGVTIGTDLFSVQSTALAGLLPAIFQLFAGISQYLSDRVKPVNAILSGALVIAIMQVLLAGSALLGLTWFLLIAIPICGMGYGANFVCGAALVNATATEETRTRRIGQFYVVGYLSMSFPILAIGRLIDVYGIGTAFYVFCAVECVLALLGVLLSLRIRLAMKDA
jgi:MFS family permease